MNVFLQQGHVYVGVADLPFFLSASTLEDKAADNGWNAAHVFDRSDPRSAALKPVADAAARSGHSDDWDTIAIGQWARPSQSVDLPSAVAWIADLDVGQAPAPGGASSTPTASTGLLSVEECAAPWRRFTAVVSVIALGVGLGVGVLLGRSRWLRRRQSE